ncbi:MAG: sulfatase-like hydrolase/transferase [Rubripirellula sp.]
MKPYVIPIVLLACLTPSAFAAESKPNVLLFLVDDMGVMDSSVPFLADVNGKAKRYPLNDFYRTPNMERLASMGTRFANFYANSVCSPTRTTLMNGQSSARHHTTQYIKPESKNTGDFGPKTWKWEGFTKADTTLPAQLRAAGYRTIHSGKAHLGPVGAPAENPLNIGFDVNIAGCAYGQPGSYLGMKNYGNGIRSRVNRAAPGLEKYHGTKTHLTEACTIEMKAAISEAVSKQEPFFAYMSHYAVHAPFEADERFVDNYRKGKPARLAAFASLIEGMDKSLGDLLDHLESIGVAENTLVIFLGDNGTDAPIGDAYAVSCAAPLRGKKATHYEGGMRVPFIAAWGKRDPQNSFQKEHPVVRGSHVTEGFGQISDVYATILDITKAKPDANHKVDGISLLPALGGESLPTDREFLMHFPHSHRTSYFTVLVRGNDKIVYHYPVGKEAKSKGRSNFPRVELFDLAADPTESKNLADSHPELKRAMTAAMVTALEDAGAQYPVRAGKILKPAVESFAPTP